MKTPRTIKILQLMLKLIGSIMHNEKILLRGSIAQLDALGGVYIKFLQIIVLNLDSQEQENFNDLLAVYENSEPDLLNIKQYLTKDDSKQILSNFSFIAEQPLATGSFGQVYRAKLHSGEEVVIKVLRPSVIKYLRYDLRLLGILCTIYNIFDRQRMINFRQIYKEFRRTCFDETNYLREIEAADAYHQIYKDHPKMVVPRTYRQFSSQRVIVQDYIEGVSLVKLLEMQASGQDARLYIRNVLSSDLFIQLHTIGYELLSRAITGSLIQADPHPGNIILLPYNKVALIDFGMVTQLSKNRTAFYEMLLQYQAYYSGNLVIENFALAALKYLSPKLYSAMLEADKIFNPQWGTNHNSLIEKVRSATLKVANEQYSATTMQSLLERKMIARVLFFVINKGNRFGFTFDLSAVNLLKAAHTYLSLVGQFDHDATVIAQVINDVVLYAQQNLDRVVSQQSAELKPAEALEVLSTWFDKMARNDPWLMNEVLGGYIQ